MANLLHTKGTRTQIYKTLPSNSVGNDGDIILSQIQGKGVYLCSKVNGRWHVSNKMEELRKIEKTSIKDLKLDRIRVGNTTITKDEYNVSSGDFTLDVDGDIKLNADDGQVTIKDDTATHFLFDCNNTRLRIYDDTNASDFFTILVAANGTTTLSTFDNDGVAGHLTLNSDGSIILDPADGKFIAKNNGTEFSSADSAYAGMVIGYTYLQPSGSSATSHTLQTSFTVEDSTHQISFIVPPSGNVEIEITAFFDRTSTSDVTIYAGLSDNSTYNSIGEIHEYDMGGVKSDDEIDDEIITWKWTLTSLTPNNSLTYYVGFKSSDASAVNLKYGFRSTHNLAHQPFIIKAIALPSTIYDGT